MDRDCHNILAWCRNHFSQLFNVHMFSDVRQTDIYTFEQLVPELNAFEFEMPIAKLKRQKSAGIDQIQAELFQARVFLRVIHMLINSIWNKEELPEEWKKSIIVPIYKRSDKTDCSNYRGISLLPTIYKILSNILLSRLTPYAGEIIGDRHCGFRRIRSTTDHVFCNCQILKKKWE